jgi:NADPH:quinone reductase-like Zn-dependent oxidoreductase
VEMPVLVGHEFAGVVSAVGSGVTGVSEGERAPPGETSDRALRTASGICGARSPRFVSMTDRAP